MAQGLNGNTVLKGEVSKLWLKKGQDGLAHKKTITPELQPHYCGCHLTVELPPSFRKYALWI